MDRVWIPLQGEGGVKPKAPAVVNWQSPMYEGVHIAADEHHEAWLGLRTDGMVVVDFDTEAAFNAWHEAAGTPERISYTRRTPHGYHIFYEWTAGSPDGNRVRVLPDTDIRAGRGGQVAFYAPGYKDVGGSLDDLTPFDPSWLPEPKAGMQTDYEWSSIPDGRGNITMTSLAGTLRRQGADFPTILRSLAAFNAITMPEEPMSDDMLIQIAKSVSRYEADPDVEEFKLVGEDADEDEDEPETEEAPRYLSLHAMPKPEETTWLLEPFIPNDTLTLLDGEEGIGKGMFCVMLAAKMIFSDEPRNVLWYSTEDTPEQIHARILEFGEVEEAAGDVAFWNQVHPFPTFPKAAEQIDLDIQAFNPGLIILDAGKDMLDSSATPGEQFSTWSAHAVRPGLLALMRLAQKRHVPIVFIAHWNKTKGGIRERSADSNAFRQVVRQHVAMAEVGLLKALSVEKSNLKRGKAFTVHSCKIVNGQFEITRHLPAFQSLLEWIKAQEGDGDTEIKVERAQAAD